MRNWQRYWLFFVLIFSSIHAVRDVLQFLNIETIISTSVVRAPIQSKSLLWHPLNTVLIESIAFGLAYGAYRRNQFGWKGLATICIAVVTMLGFCWYWFILD